MAESITNIIVRIFRPLLTRTARAMARPKRVYTWQWEATFVATVLISVSLLTTPWDPFPMTAPGQLRDFLVIWISAAAVFCSFLHAQIGTYMAEDMGSTEQPLTECYYKLDTYWVYKEILWFAVFFATGAYPAIAGNLIFIIYPAWRKLYKEERRKFLDQQVTA